jgi:hypothetical protein
MRDRAEVVAAAWPSEPMVAVGRLRVSAALPAAIRFALRQLLVPRSRRERWLLAASARLPSRIGLQLLALGAGPPTGVPATGQALELERRLLAENPLGPGDASMRVRLLAHSGQGHQLGFLFRCDDRHPGWVIKTGPRRGQERAHLLRLRAALPAGLREALPEPLASVIDEGTEALLLTALPGRSFAAAFSGARRGRRERLLEAAAGWLAQFHRATVSGAGALPAALEPRGDVGDAARAELARGLAAGALRPSSIHGDYWPRNLLVDARGERILGVVDWEALADYELPHRDLFDFVLAAAAVATDGGRGERPVEAFRRGLLEPTPLRAALRCFLATYLRERDLEPRWLEPLLALHLAELAEGVRELGVAPPQARREAAREWWRLYEGAGRSVFSG